MFIAVLDHDDLRRVVGVLECLPGGHLLLFLALVPRLEGGPVLDDPLDDQVRGHIRAGIYLTKDPATFRSEEAVRLIVVLNLAAVNHPLKKNCPSWSHAANNSH